VCVYVGQQSYKRGVENAATLLAIRFTGYLQLIDALACTAMCVYNQQCCLSHATDFRLASEFPLLRGGINCPTIINVRLIDNINTQQTV